MFPPVSAAAIRIVPGIIAAMFIVVLFAIITRRATVGLSAPSVNWAAVAVAAYDHADFIHWAAAGIAMVGNPP